MIRPATSEDAAAIKDLIAQYPDQLVQDHVPQVDEFFVAEEDNKVIGCCALEIYSQRLAEIRSLAVAKEYQGKGVGTALIEQCLAKARARNVQEVLSITSAVPLFEKQGFGTFKNEKFALIKVLN
ncbi:GNAT family N-acetyltransferase [Candidatus Parcubacteria bacterium]|nr:MAG: GNAT family N-acetyltransferase [Candidatus Parcubacteria bacterium]